MASNFKYKTSSSTSVDLIDLSAKCDSLMVGKYGTNLNAKNYCPDTTNLVTYSTSLLNGLWGNKLASYCNNYKVGTSSTGIAARGCAPVPKRYNNGSHISQINIQSSCRLVHFIGGTQSAHSGDGIYYGTSAPYTFLTSRTSIVIDIVGGGGGGSGGNTGSNLGAHSRGGAGGGSGAWASYLIDMTVWGDFWITIGSGGSGGGCESDGSSGGASYLSIYNSSLSSGLLDTCSGGGGGKGSNYWDGCGDAGSGGGISKGALTDAQLTTYGIYRLASGGGAAGGKGAAVDGGHAAGSQGGNGPSSVSFGGLVNFTNVSCYGGSAAKAASYNYDDFDERVAIGGGGGGSLLASGGHGGGSMATYNTINKSAGGGSYGSGGGGSAGGKTISRGGGSGGTGVARIYWET